MSNDGGRDLAFLIAGFGLGTLVGTVVGMLVAPKSGRELRSDIVEHGKDYYGKGRDKAREAYESGRDRAKEYSSKVGERLGEVKDQIGETAQKITNKVRREESGEEA